MITSTVTRFANDFPSPLGKIVPRTRRLSMARATISALQPFEGIWVPIITPFRDGCVDFEALQRLASDLVNSGIRGLVVCGTTGEACHLDDKEQAAVLSAVLEAVGPGYPVVMGISGSDTRAVTRKVRDFSEYDIAGFLVSAPCYVRPSQEGILLHFRACASATDRPIILYNVPARSGVNIDLSTVIALSADPQFVAMKESSGNIAQLEDTINQTPLKVLSGDDTLILTTLCFGGHGAIAAAAHIRPDLYVHMYKLVRAGQLEQARAVFNRLLPLIRLLFSEPNPAPVKAVLALQGRVREELRLPMNSVSKTCKAKLAVALGQVMAIPPVWPITSSRSFPELRAFYESEQFSESGER
jgi:4-hydroxy-tetrahydrodipicolinate synthase